MPNISAVLHTHIFGEGRQFTIESWQQALRFANGLTKQRRAGQEVRCDVSSRSCCFADLSQIRSSDFTRPIRVCFMLIAPPLEGNLHNIESMRHNTRFVFSHFITLWFHRMSTESTRQSSERHHWRCPGQVTLIMNTIRTMLPVWGTQTFASRSRVPASEDRTESVYRDVKNFWQAFCCSKCIQLWRWISTFNAWGKVHHMLQFWMCSTELRLRAKEWLLRCIVLIQGLVQLPADIGQNLFEVDA